MNRDISRILLSEGQISDMVDTLGKQISEDYKGKNLMLLGLLKGSVVFLSDLMRKIDIPLAIDFMAVSSYGAETKTSGRVRVIKDIDIGIGSYDILIVEDILDSGTTLSYISEIIRAKKPKSLKICTLLDKPERRMKNITADYRGFVIPDEFVVGYGLDYGEKYRNLPYIGVLKEEIYSNRA